MAVKKTQNQKPVESEAKRAPSKKSAAKSQPTKPKTTLKKKEVAVSADPPSSKLIHQFIPFILWVVAILFAACVIVHNIAGGDMGVAGSALGDGLCGLFGLGALLMPVLIAFLAVKWHKFVDTGRVAGKTVLAVIALIFTSAFIHTFVVKSADFDVEYMWNKSMEPSGGGVLGGLVCELFFMLFERIGAIIITLAGLLISLMFLFNLTPKNIYTFIRYRAKLAAEKREARRAEEDERRYEEQLRMERELLMEKKKKLHEEKAPKSVKAPEPEEFEEFKEPEPVPAEKPKLSIKKKDAAPDIMDQMPEPPEPEFDEDEDKPQLGVIFNNEQPRSTGIQIDLPPVGEKEEKPKAAAPRAEKKQEPVGDVKLSMKVDTEQLSELEALRGGDAEVEPEPPKDYVFPSTELLKRDTNQDDMEEAKAEMNENARILRETLKSFNIGIKDNILCSRGPTITRYELRPEVGVRVRSIANLVDDISLSLASSGVRIEAPIPNKPYVGIEVPNQHRLTVFLRTLIENEKFQSAQSKLSACLGADVGGNPVMFDIAKMPHLLIAGATGMGKSVCINSIIVSLLFKATPDEVKLILIDPKKVEFSIYKDIPHLYAPIVSDPKKAAGALASAVAEMDRRFELIEEVGVRDINSYNEITADDPTREYMPKMVIVIDELADLMMTAPGEVEASICRLAQKARAAGIHIIIGTQRPSVDVITGLIKANVPSRIACTVASQVDSRTIIDIAGAEKLIGKGDMLFAPVGISKPMRVQGCFVSDSEVEAVVEFIKENNAKAEYNKEFISTMESESAKVGNKKGASGGGGGDGEGGGGETDPKFREAVKLAIEAQKISTSLMQRMLNVGYGRAAKIIDQMEDLGYVSPPDGNKPRKVLITMQEYMEKVINDDIDVADTDEE